jgi:hypothetical protein
MYRSKFWQRTASCWEVLMSVFFAFPGAPALWLLGTCIAAWHWRHTRHRRASGAARKKPKLVAVRDLDV